MELWRRVESESSGEGQWIWGGGEGDNVKGRGHTGTRSRECDVTFRGSCEKEAGIFVLVFSKGRCRQILEKEMQEELKEDCQGMQKNQVLVKQEEQMLV